MMQCKETAENFGGGSGNLNGGGSGNLNGGGSGNLNGGGTQNFNGNNQIDEGGHRGGQRPRNPNPLPAPQR